MDTFRIKSFDEFKARLETDQELQEQFRKDPLGAVGKFEQSPLYTDKWIYRIIVIALSLIVFAIIVGVLYLIGSGTIEGDQGVPTILTAIGSAAIGALAGLLAPSPK